MTDTSKPEWPKGQNNLERSYNIISEWAQACDGLDVARAHFAVLQKLIHTALEAKERAARADALEATCKKLCLHCRNGISAVSHKGDVAFKHFVNDGLQPRGDDGRYVGCAASVIRSLIGAEGGR